MGELPAFDGIVLAGGAARRLGGVDKASVTIGNETLLERVVGALAGAQRVIAVGPKRTASLDVVWTREDPPGGGPVAALAAGMQLVTARMCVLLAVDVPFISTEVVARLVDACEGRDAALVADGEGTPQPLIAAFDSAALRVRLKSLGPPAGASMKSLLDGCEYALLDEPEAAHDCDTWADVGFARQVGGV